MKNTSDDMIEIRPILKTELPSIRMFPPADWNLDLETVYAQHFGRPYFYPIVATSGPEIVGTGIAVIHENAAWLGTIIVPDAHRSRGIGRAVTEHLIAHAQGKGIETILLTASALGLPIYQKIGFQHDVNYAFYKADAPLRVEFSGSCIRPVAKRDHDEIFALDLAVTGEQRSSALAHYVESGFVYDDGAIKGFYLPDFGKGLIVGAEEKAGVDLLSFRLSRDQSPVCVPEDNHAAIDRLTSLGFSQYKTIPRMYLNRNIVWSPKNVYTRGSGYMG